jgi:hypothetical protein
VEEGVDNDERKLNILCSNVGKVGKGIFVGTDSDEGFSSSEIISFEKESHVK